MVEYIEKEKESFLYSWLFIFYCIINIFNYVLSSISWLLIWLKFTQFIVYLELYVLVFHVNLERSQLVVQFHQKLFHFQKIISVLCLIHWTTNNSNQGSIM